MNAADLQPCVRAAILEALEACSPAAAPFLVLREAGVVAQLRGTLLTRLGESGSRVTARLGTPSLRRGAPLPERRQPADAPDRRVQTCRVQLEMKAFDGPLGGCRALNAPRTDLVVLRNEVQLYCWPDGPGDVVSLIAARDVASFVEVKASPSLNLGEVCRYARDIGRLLATLKVQWQAWQGDERPSAFFVLVDKSSSHFAQGLDGPLPQAMDWGRDDAGERCLSSVIATHSKCLAQGKGARKALNVLKDLRIKLGHCVPGTDVPYVEILTLDCLSGTASSRRFAYSMA